VTLTGFCFPQFYWLPAVTSALSCKEEYYHTIGTFSTIYCQENRTVASTFMDIR